jgi:parallel beta-helix repeat protein
VRKGQTGVKTFKSKYFVKRRRGYIMWRVGVWLVVTLFFASLVGGCLNSLTPESGTPSTSLTRSPGVIKVPDDFPTIQEAINAAENGNTILVAEGVYYENIVIDKSLTLRGIGRPVIDGSLKASEGWEGTVVIIEANGVTIEGFEIMHGANGIAGETSNSTIRNNVIHHNYNYKGFNGVGILLWGDNDNNQIEDNVIHHNDRQGIFIGFWDTSEISSGNTISGNLIHHNGLYTMPNGPDPSAYGIQLWNADNNLIENNHIHHHNNWYFAQGVYLCNSAGNRVQYNRLQHNQYGIGIYCYSHGAGTNAIQYNNIYGNTEYGVRNFDAEPVDATYNWWGHPSGPSGGVVDPSTQEVADGKGDVVSGNVYFDPWLGKPSKVK